MKKSVLLLLIGFLGLPISILAQETKSYPKHAVYVNGGSLILYGAINLNYERVLYQSEGFFKQYGIRVGGGGLYFRDNSALHLLFNGFGLTGMGNHHFELSTGTLVTFDQKSYNNANRNSSPIATYLGLSPSLSLGYRYQKPGEEFLFKGGVSYPEGLYVGLGLGF